MARILQDVSQELLSLEDAKSFIKVTHDLEDNIISGLITQARNLIANETSYAIGEQVWGTTEKIRGRYINSVKSPYVPLISLVVIIDDEEIDISSAIIDLSTGNVEFDSPLFGTKMDIEWTVGADQTNINNEIFESWKSLVGFMYENRGADDQVDLPQSVKSTFRRNRVYRL